MALLLWYHGFRFGFGFRLRHYKYGRWFRLGLYNRLWFRFYNGFRFRFLIRALSKIT
jgi:hypothetical protein